MRVSGEKLPHAKSYTSIYDLFGSTPFNNILYKNTKHKQKDLSVFQTTCGDTDKARIDTNSLMLNTTQYVTSEKYHLLNKEHSFGSVARSTSTIFYDLDDIAKRHSFHCFNDVSSSNVNLLKVMKIPMNTNGFTGKSNAIVQECATQIQPKLLPKDSIEINTKKIKKTYPNECVLSSEIFLRDDAYYDDGQKCYYGKDITDMQQKFWSFAKYRTEYTNPIPEEKKHKKKDRGKRTEDPCPCQLFSYACPCTDKKSLTELAKNSKSLTVADQVTSTSKFKTQEEADNKSNTKAKKPKNTPREDKLLSTDYVEVIEKYELIPTKNEPIINVSNKHDMPTITDVIQNDNVSKTSKTSKSKSLKKHRKITCPKCRENVDVLLSTTDEEESMKYVNSSLYRFKDNSSKHKSSKTNRQKSLIAEDHCYHEPRCELVPVCQILPTDNIYMTHKCLRKQSNQKTSPRIIRITKACRHHPPCTVVPSCQRANVLKNNCEYIPPCLHRPRCVNLPLCVPLKNLHYEEPAKNVDDVESDVQCPHIPKCKYYPECQYEPLGNNIENNVNIVSQMQNACEFLSEIQQQPFLLSPKVTCPQNISSPSPVISPTSCNCCKSNKSCQYNCPDCKCNSGSNANNIESNEAVIFIRDVGCQFRNKRCSPKESADQSKVSSASFDFVDVKMGNYYTNVHTLRYEDKFTNPMVDEEFSETSVSIISLEIDSHCPTHGERASRKRSERTTGFIPKPNTSPYVAFTTQRSPVVPQQMYPGNNEMTDVRSPGQGYAYGAYSVKSRRSFLKSKYKKMFSVKRRRKSRPGSSHFSFHTRKQTSVPN